MTRFVYFDLGGVVILDFSGTDNWEKLKKELCVRPDRNQEFEDFFKKYEPEVCLGKDVESLLPLITEKFGSKLPVDYSLLIDGFVNRFQVNKSIWPVIEKIHQRCKIGLLTNQYPYMLDAIAKKGLLPSVSWDVVVDSSIVGLRKPDSKIFQLAEEKAGARGQEILFVENSLNHVQAANDFGWQTFLYDSHKPDKSSVDLLQFFRDHYSNKTYN